MKKIISLAVFCFLMGMTAIGQQVTQDMGNNVKVTFDQSLSGPYRMTWSQKSRNGGTVSKTWSGQLQNGKRTGLWTGTVRYNNYEASSNLFWSGTSTIKRNYKDGLPHGAYSITDNTKYRNGTYNSILKTWHYDQWVPNGLQLSGSFISGIPTGVWNINSTKPAETIRFTLREDGSPDGTFTFEADTWKFKNGYLIEQTTMKDATWGFKLQYTPEEIAAFTPEQAKKKPFLVSNYMEYYLIGGPWESEVTSYPEHASTEPRKLGTYMTVAYDEHLQLFGNAPQYERDMIQVRKESAKKEASNRPLFEKEKQYMSVLDVWYKKNKKRGMQNSQKTALVMEVDKQYPELATYEWQSRELKGSSYYSYHGILKSYKNALNCAPQLLKADSIATDRLIHMLKAYCYQPEEIDSIIHDQTFMESYLFSPSSYGKQFYERYESMMLSEGNKPLTIDFIKHYYMYFQWNGEIEVKYIKKLKYMWYTDNASRNRNAIYVHSIPLSFDEINIELTFEDMLKQRGGVKQEKFEKKWPKILKKLSKQYPEIK